MQLFSPERPELPGGTKALLREGSAVPRITVTVVEDMAFELSVHLRNFNTNERSYSYYTKVLDICELRAFFESYCSDPEDTLRWYFNWTDQAPQAIGRPTYVDPAVRRNWQEAEELL